MGMDDTDVHEYEIPYNCDALIARATDSIALEADVRIDVWTSAGVFAGLVLIKITGAAVIDPIIAIFVALLIIKVAYDLIKEAGGRLWMSGFL